MHTVIWSFELDELLCPAYPSFYDIFCVGRITFPIFDSSDDFNQLSRVDMLRSHHSVIVNTSVETLLYCSRDDVQMFLWLVWCMPN